MKKAILFDLDGTLLPMPSQEEFVKIYFGELVKKRNYDPKRLIDTVWKGTKAMVLNDGSKTNEEVFWEVFTNDLKDLIDDFDDLKEAYNDFYANEFNKAKVATYANENAKKLIEHLKTKGIEIILATNPIFPLCAVGTRLAWIDLSLEDFDFVTTYENMSACKPNPRYYQDILKRSGLKEDEVIMVGNDVNEDIVPTAKIGIESLLITDTKIGDIDSVDVPKMTFAELVDEIDKYID